MKSLSLFIVGVVLTLLGLVMLIDPRVDVLAAIVVALSGFFLAFFASGPITVRIEDPLPPLTEEERKLVVASLTELAVECEYDEPSVGIFANPQLANYFQLLANRVKENRL